MQTTKEKKSVINKSTIGGVDKWQDIQVHHVDNAVERE
ncbi:hypothetical protein QQO_0104 [Clostridioides difficile P3]|nr:hypothetical protein QCW_0099 [Clostridioides difficile CD69]EQH16781.1 hypothetical protein QKO_0133 [Clostridioides difficile DA00195]EQI96604.1 hypothetical protein QQO_0104 [Clostridioides difficile P3]